MNDRGHVRGDAEVAFLRRLEGQDVAENPSALAGLTRRIFRGRPQTPDLASAGLRLALREEGCPLCITAQGSDGKWLAHFLHESYLADEVLESFLSGPGLCADHGRHLLPLGVHKVTIAILHQRLAVRTSRALGEGRGQQSARLANGCAACDHRDDVERRQAFFLARLLERDGMDAYGSPGAACQWHLPILLDEISSRQLPHLLRFHHGLLGEADAVFAGPDEAEMKRWIARIAGRDSGRSKRGDVLASREERDSDPVRRMRNAMGASSGCPVCEEVSDVWRAWIAWLDEATDAGQAVDDILPTCRRHVEDVMRHGGGNLKRATARRMARVYRHEIETAGARFSDPALEQSTADRLLAWVGNRAQAPGWARTSLRRRPHCPFCQSLHSACDRALDLIAALLGEKPGQEAFAEGYGLCVRHARTGMARHAGTDAEVRIADKTDARLGVLEWELEELRRKTAWNTRPERRGTEASAWGRAVFRFSGTVHPDGP